jgi:transcriptional regulator with XRE-family HTH domain
MEQQQIISDIEQRAKAAGLTMSELCSRAQVHPTTVSRWKLSARNPKPKNATIRVIGRLDIALREIEAA